jgi:hypothetical protein
MKAQKLSQLRRYYETVKNSQKLAEAIKLQIALLQVDIIAESASIDLNSVDYL